MIRLLTVLVIVVALSGTVSAGVQMHQSGHDAVMNCCKLALSHDGSQESSGAKLYCALNCQEAVPTGTSGVQTVSAPANALSTVVVPRSGMDDLNVRLFSQQLANTLANSQPTYIRNLALLI